MFNPSKIEINSWAISLVMSLTHSSHYPISPLVCYNKNTVAYKAPLQSAVTSVPDHWPLGEHLAGRGRAGAAVPASEVKPNPLFSLTGRAYFLLSFCKINGNEIVEKNRSLFYWIQLVMTLKKGVQELGTVERWGQNQEVNMWGKREIKPCTKPASQEPKVVRSCRTSVGGEECQGGVGNSTEGTGAIRGSELSART